MEITRLGAPNCLGGGCLASLILLLGLEGCILLLVLVLVLSLLENIISTRIIIIMISLGLLEGVAGKPRARRRHSSSTKDARHTKLHGCREGAPYQTLLERFCSTNTCILAFTCVVCIQAGGGEARKHRDGHTDNQTNSHHARARVFEGK